MTKFIIRRLILGVFIVFFGCFIVYAVMRCMPTSYVEKLARERSAAAHLAGSGVSYEEMLADLNKRYGMDTDVVTGYLKWFGRAITMDFGESWTWSKNCVEKFGDVIWYSVIINVISLIVEVAVSIPLGILAARKQYSVTDYAVTIFALLGISLPSFFLSTILKYVFACRLKIFDTHGLVGRYYYYLDTWGKVLDIGKHMVMPIVVLAMLSVGGLMRYTRTNMLEVLNADYIRTARAKGLSEKKVINKHAFRNTLIPLVSYMSYLIPSMFGGAMITETLFQIPGIGYVSYQSIVAGDIPFTMFYNAFILVLTQVSLIIADIMYAVVDPRVRAN